MSFKTGAFSVTTGAQKLIDLDPDERENVAVYNPSTNTATVYVGGSDVTTANGFPLEPGASPFWIPVGDNNDLYVIGDSACTVRYLRAT